MKMRRTVVLAGSLGLVAMLTSCAMVGPIETDTVSYDVSDEVTALEVETDALNVEVVESDRQGIHVTEHLQWRRTKPTTSHEARGGTLVLGFTCPGGLMGGAASCDVGYTVEIPRGLSVKAVSDSGDVKLRALSGKVEAQTDSGAIEAAALTGKEINSKSDSGDITLAFDARPDKVETLTDSGASVLRVPEGPYNVTLTTDSGARKLNTAHDPSAKRTINVSSDSGDIEVATS